MADINEIRELARRLNLMNVASGAIDISKEYLSNTDYLYDILSKELEIRHANRLREIEHDARLPNKRFSHKSITEGLELELTKIKNFDFKNGKANILIVGDCCTGKTGVAVEIAKAAIEKEARVIYETVDDLLFIIKAKKRRWSHILKADLIILDELFYVEPTKEELLEIYRALTFLGETRSLILITNRGLSKWKRMDVDRHLIETLQQRLMHDFHLIHLK